MSEKFKSFFEKEIFEHNKKTGIEYEVDKLPYVVTHQYTPDFTIIRKDGSKIFIETKGYLRPTDLTKMRSVKQSNPDADIRMVFMKNNKISSKSKMRYSDWCEKYGFMYSFGSIPKDWFK